LQPGRKPSAFFYRIDHQWVTSGLAATAKLASVFKEQWFSEHAPLTVDYDFSL
jgi:exodeoxyribonuclease III